MPTTTSITPSSSAPTSSKPRRTARPSGRSSSKQPAAPALPKPSELNVSNALQYVEAVYAQSETHVPSHIPYCIAMLKSSTAWKREHVMQCLKQHSALVHTPDTPAHELTAMFSKDRCSTCHEHIYLQHTSGTKPNIFTPCGHATCSTCWMTLGLSAKTSWSTSHLLCPCCRTNVSQWYEGLYVPVLDKAQPVQYMLRSDDGDFGTVHLKFTINWWQGKLTAHAITNGFVDPSTNSLSPLSTRMEIADFEGSRGSVFSGASRCAGHLCVAIPTQIPLVLNVSLRGDKLVLSQPYDRDLSAPLYDLDIDEVAYEVYRPLRITQPAKRKRRGGGEGSDESDGE